MSARWDAVIVGAGVAGSACAILLARCGWKVALVERQRFPRSKVCGECLGASSFALLDILGVGAAVRAAAGPELRELVLMRGARSVRAPLPAADSGAQAWSRVVGRELLDTLLVAQAAACGVALWQPWALQGVQGSAGDWRCSLRAVDTQERMTLQADVLIDAHGSWEPLQALRAPVPSTASQLLAFKAHFQHTDLAAGTLPVLLFEGGYGGMVLGAQGLATLACCIRRDRLNALRSLYPATSAGASVQAMLQQTCSGVQQALQGAVRAGPWLAAGPLVPGMHLRADDAVLRVGNAAGEAHPLIGEGMAMALQSAWLLSHSLQQARSQPVAAAAAWQAPVARAYAAQWARLLRPRLRVAAVFARLALQRAAAPALMALLQAQPALLTRAARWGGKADAFDYFSRSNHDANHPEPIAADPDQGLPTGA
ncbi:MAG: FAD-dependent monooxygenase [Rhodoferax sp.]|nr:FAD-dependent monooxygenase [Rhodoferax sp.]